MATLYQAKQIVNNAPLMSADGADDQVCLVGDFVTVAGIVAGDIIEMCGLPAGYVPVDATMAAGASVGATFTSDCGILSGNYGVADNARTIGNEAWAAATAGQGAAGLQRCNKAALLQLAPADNDRGIGIKVATLATLVVGTTVRLNVIARPALDGV